MHVKIKRRQLRNKLTDWNSIKRHKKQAKNVYEPKLRPSEIGITAPEVQEKVMICVLFVILIMNKKDQLI